MAAPRTQLVVSERGQQPVLAFGGPLDAEGSGVVWNRAIAAARRARGRGLVIDLARVTLLDTSGAAFVLALERASGAEASIEGGEAQFRPLLARMRAALPGPTRPTRPRSAGAGDLLGVVGREITDVIAFTGEVAVALVMLPNNLRVLRREDLLRYADQAGVRSLPLVILLGFLIGVILAFQSAVPMRRFGADLYVPNLVAIILFRELGPLIAAVILAGRTGSAFAAEIGTMRVNEEVDALMTMGLDPVTMLVLPRLIAVMVAMPVMSLVLITAGLIGMGTVMTSFGFPAVLISNQVVSAVQPADLFQGLIKAFCFGGIVAAIGCRQGLRTGVGPRAVGLAATGAVVGGIVGTIVLDGLFAVLIYRLGY
ncbi:MAG: ABC transporter permease [Acetobacteraceae bacterium]|nr:ABC transporter permease [Acetobacteraceae bacterium]